MFILELIWAALHPWGWVAGAMLAAGIILHARGQRVPAYAVAIISAFPLWLSMNSCITHALSCISGLTTYEVHLLKALPYVWAVVVVVDLFTWLKISVRTEAKTEE